MTSSACTVITCASTNDIVFLSFREQNQALPHPADDDAASDEHHGERRRPLRLLDNFLCIQNVRSYVHTTEENNLAVRVTKCVTYERRKTSRRLFVGWLINFCLGHTWGDDIEVKQ